MRYSFTTDIVTFTIFETPQGTCVVGAPEVTYHYEGEEESEPFTGASVNVDLVLRGLGGSIAPAHQALCRSQG